MPLEGNNIRGYPFMRFSLPGDFHHIAQEGRSRGRGDWGLREPGRPSMGL